MKFGDARVLIASLMADGSAESVEAAGLIEVAIRRRLAGLALSAQLRDAVVAALQNAPDGLLQLREHLIVDQLGAQRG